MAGFIGACILWRLGGTLWVIDRHIHATEREIQDREGGFREHDLKKLADEIIKEFDAVIFCRKRFQGHRNA